MDLRALRLLSETKKSVEVAAAELGISRRLGFLYNRVGCASASCKDAIRINILDLNTAELLLSISDLVHKTVPSAKGQFDKFLNTPLSNAVITDFKNELLRQVYPEGISAVTRKVNPRKISGRLSFWEQVKTIEKVLAKHKTIELSGKDRKHITVEAERFFKGLGAKRFNVKV